MIAELGGAYLSNEAGILDSVRFENSAAYLASWAQKLENDPRLIVSAASQAQRASDFIMGIERKESLQECQISPEGMPLNGAREHGIDTRIPDFAHLDQDGDGVSTLIEADRPDFPADTPALSVAMKDAVRHILAHLRFDRAHLHPSFRQGGRRVLAAPAFRKGCKRAHLFRFARLLPPIHSFLALSPRNPASGGTNRRLDLPSHRLDNSDDPPLSRPLRPSSYLRSNTG